jgi:plasmid stability protein
LDYGVVVDPMPSLQIRDCPEPLHQLLQLRARHHHRSLSQQACGGDARERRRQALEALKGLSEQQPTRLFEPSPEELIRQDRAR